MCVVGGSLGYVIFPLSLLYSGFIQKLLVHIKLIHITLMGCHCGGFAVKEVKMPAAPAAEQNASV